MPLQDYGWLVMLGLLWACAAPTTDNAAMTPSSSPGEGIAGPAAVGAAISGDGAIPADLPTMEPSRCPQRSAEQAGDDPLFEARRLKRRLVVYAQADPVYLSAVELTPGTYVYPCERVGRYFGVMFRNAWEGPVNCTFPFAQPPCKRGWSIDDPMSSSITDVIG